jgi:hypothetical protein
MYKGHEVTLMNQGPRRPDAPEIRRTTPLATTHLAGPDMAPDSRPDRSAIYDALDLRLMDTFPASDAVARY